MLRNRSVPVDTVLPHLAYEDLEAAIAWLSTTFGFAEHFRYGRPDGVQMHLDDAWIMLERARPGRASPARLGAATQSPTVFVKDVDAHCQRTRAAGATIEEELHETAYGARQYGVEDLEGHRWLFAAHARDVDPSEWGATAAEPV